MNRLEWQLLEEHTPLEFVSVSGVEIKTGMRVILRPRGRSDIFDMALADKIAVVESILQTYEDRVQLAVVLEDDPGRDLGMMRQPGHRFFFTPEEVEPLREEMKDEG